MESGDDDLPDHLISVPYYDGTSSSPTTSGGVAIGVNDADTIKSLIHTADIAEGGINSLHTEDDSTSYQNTSGSTAHAVVLVTCVGSGTAERHIKFWSSPNDNSKTSATALYEFGSTTLSIMDATGEVMTIGPLAIQDNHYLVLENIDDSRAGTNSLEVIKNSWVVERG